MYFLLIFPKLKMFTDPYYTPSSDIGGPFSLEVSFIRLLDFRELDLKPPKLRSCLLSPTDVPRRFILVKCHLSAVSAKVLVMLLPLSLVIHQY